MSRSPRYSGGGPPSGGAPPPSGHQSWDDHSCTKYLPQVSCYLLHVQNTPQGPTPGIGWCSRYFLWLDQFGKSCFGGRVILKHGFLHPKTVGHRLPCTANTETQRQIHKDKHTKTNTQRHSTPVPELHARHRLQGEVVTRVASSTCSEHFECSMLRKF